MSDVSIEGDRVLFNRRDENPVLSHPVQSQGFTNSRWGRIAHDDLTANDGRQRVTTDKGREVTVSIPTLSEYVTLTPRMVTPVRFVQDDTQMPSLTILPQ